MRAAYTLILGLVIATSFLACNGSNDTKPNQIKISKENLALEAHFGELLEPISAMKESEPGVYWFIVSWMGTNYGTPNWQGYGEDGWKKKAKQRGIDCSGFSRVMMDQVFSKKVRGGSQGILNDYCKRRKKEDLVLGDLVFFRAPYAKNDRIVHVGVYLQDGYFVHATSKKSAAQGLGLNINHLDEKNWSQEFVTGGKVE